MKRILVIVIACIAVIGYLFVSDMLEEIETGGIVTPEMNFVTGDGTQADTHPTEAETAAESDTADSPATEAVSESESSVLYGESYYETDDVAYYLYTYDELPPNFMTKKEAQALGWVSSEGNLWDVADGACIGGDRFGNYEGLLPEDRDYTECDIDTQGAEKRGAKRIVFSDDGLIYYTDDHYESFELLYGEP